MYTTIEFRKVEENRPITRERDVDFIFQLQCGVLLSLKEDGFLTQMQYQRAEEKLKEQRNAMKLARTEGR